jgi:membrane protease YdiL (CAAX protease family)
VWTNEVFDPPAGADYTRVLSGPGQRAATAVGGLIAALLCFELAYPLIADAVLGIGYLVRGRPDGSFVTYGDDALGFAYPEGMLAAHLALAGMIPLTMLLVRYLHQRRPVWLTSVQPGMRWRFLIVAGVVAVVVMNAVYWLTGGRTSFQYDPEHGWQVWMVLIVVTVPLQAAGEEYLFRGYLTQVIGSFVKTRWVTVVASSLFFAVAHGGTTQMLTALAHGSTDGLSLFVNRFGFGLVMGVLVIVTGGLEAGIAAHAVNNLFAFAYAALSAGGVAGARSLTDVSWSVTAWNLVAYALVGLAAWTIGTRLNVARGTPADGG